VIIGQVKWAGQSTEKQFYSFRDINPLPLSYYRLKQVDLDNKITFSSIITLKKQKSVFKINKLHPSVINDKLTCEITTPKSNFLELSILDVVGRTIWSKKILNIERSLVETIGLASINTDNYFLHFQNEKSVLDQQFIKY
jgi:hypothetical protein